MIINNSKKFIFVHILKTAGEAVSITLSPHAEWRDFELGGTPYGKRLGPVFQSRYGLWKHSKARDIRAVVGDAVWRDYTTFAVVRDPYARALSLYRYLELQAHWRGWRRHLARISPRERQRDPWKWPMMRVFLDSGSFAAFIRHPQFGAASGTEAQASFVCEEDGRSVIVDHILRFETLEHDFRALCAGMGLPETALVKKNVSGGKLVASTAPETPSDADREVLARVYAADFDLFDYRR